MMIRYVHQTGALLSTYLGRTASHYYIKYASIQTFNELLKPHMNEGEIVIMVSKSDEFEQVKVRPLIAVTSVAAVAMWDSIIYCKYWDTLVCLYCGLFSLVQIFIQTNCWKYSCVIFVH